MTLGCVSLVIIGADERGKKEIVAIEDGFRESSQSWKEVLMDLRHRGLRASPKLAVGDGAMGFWKALREVYGDTRQQRCWMHKSGNVLNYLPKATQGKAKKALHEIWQAETREDAYDAFDTFLETYGAKYPKAADCLKKDREELLAFYDFPAEQWAHLRTTNRIESTFATVRLRTAKTRGCLSRRPCSPWSFACRSQLRNDGAACEDSNTSPTSFEESDSETECTQKPKPPDPSQHKLRS